MNQWWTSLLTHICATRPRWANASRGLSLVAVMIFLFKKHYWCKRCFNIISYHIKSKYFKIALIFIVCGYSRAKWTSNIHIENKSPQKQFFDHVQRSFHHDDYNKWWASPDPALIPIGIKNQIPFAINNRKFEARRRITCDEILMDGRDVHRRLLSLRER